MMTEDSILDGKIMIVDDEPPNVLLLEQMLKQKGYRFIRGITDSLDVVENYKEFKPDLVLLDLNMPDLDGFEVMAKIQELEHGSYPPILVLTANNSDEARLRALVSGALDFISKPFNIVEALARIKNMLEVRLLHNQVNHQNKVLDQKVRERTQELADTQLEIVQRLSRAGEYRDNETGYHIIRMSRYSEMLGRAVGMTHPECELLLQASPMHDIGKIGIPDSILLHPGKLNAEQWEIMKTHVTIGAEILSGSNSRLMDMAKAIALTHHEKWDGSGYPNGLKGEEIPIEGRIVAVADVFDALTSERPYKKAWSVEDAVTEIEKNLGKHFDPGLIGKFKKILPDILKIKEAYADAEESVAVDS